MTLPVILLRRYDVEVFRDRPFLYWKLNEASGSTAFDFSGHRRNGDIVGTLTRVAGLLETDAADETAYYSAQDNGKQILFASDTGIDGVSKKAFSFEMWMKTPDPLAGFYGFNIFQAVGDFGTAGLSFFSDGNLQGSSGVGSFATGSPAIIGGTRYHIVFTFDGQYGWIYRNGVLILGPTDLGGTVALNQGILLGSDLAANYWSGTIERTAFYRKALGAARVAAHYGAGIGSET